MKRILITGANSYIGTSAEKYFSQWPEQYHVDTVDMVDGSWREKSFTNYDSVFHVAGIAHQDSGKITEERRRQYYSVNCDLAKETATKAKADGVQQFVFMSSMIVYGSSSEVGNNQEIDLDTEPCPAGSYGDSKLMAEKSIVALADTCFCVCILRPPFIYGPGCKGNYPRIAKLARRLPFFPSIGNKRSMLFIGNLCAFLKEVIDKRVSGVQLPCNRERVSTFELVSCIAGVHGRRVLPISIFNPAIRILSGRLSIVDKVFGGMAYKQGVYASVLPEMPYSFEESIKLTEGEK